MSAKIASGAIFANGLTPQRVLRAAVGALRPAGIFNRKIHARMRVPQVHLRHRAAQRQILGADLVLVLRVGCDQRTCGGSHGDSLVGWRCADYTRAPSGSAVMV